MAGTEGTKVFCAVRHSLDPHRFYGGLWSGNFYPALRRLGCEIVESQVDLEPASRFMGVPGNFTREELEVRAQITERIVEEVGETHRRKPVDLFLGYFYNSHFDPSGFDRIHRLGISTVNFFCNSMYQFELVEEIARAVMHSWHTEAAARDRYLRAGARPVHVQMGADPDMYHPVPGVARQQSACFVGQRYADRATWLHALARASVPFHIYGAGWVGRGAWAGASSGDEGGPPAYLGRRRHRPGSLGSYGALVRHHVAQHGLRGGVARSLRQLRERVLSRRYLQDLEPYSRGYFTGALCEVFAAHEVVLSFSNVWSDGMPGSDLIPHVRLRDFEAPMSRGCLVTGHSEEIQELYVLGDEIETYRSEEELVDKVRFCLAHPVSAERLRDAGYRRAVRDHTWVSRLGRLFQLTGVRARARPTT